MFYARGGAGLFPTAQLWFENRSGLNWLGDILGWTSEFDPPKEFYGMAIPFPTWFS
ncbi:hypothetical protein [Bradyrhizobium elkanii]|uniref:hypothetical protein n=1 Tax=Bradyrhizobium elkanii TaxID=29448 RepID=UPI001484DE28|nr:hypothetical protein [Bradyrhizobium elkanii]